MRESFCAGMHNLTWDEVSEAARENWREFFDAILSIAPSLGIRIEDDQTPHGPDVAPTAALKLRERT